jgi:hypothetical protein
MQKKRFIQISKSLYLQVYQQLMIYIHKLSKLQFISKTIFYPKESLQKSILNELILFSYLQIYKK